MKKKTENFPPFLTLLNHLEYGNLAIFYLTFRKSPNAKSFFLDLFVDVLSSLFTPNSVRVYRFNCGHANLW